MQVMMVMEEMAETHLNPMLYPMYQTLIQTGGEEMDLLLAKYLETFD